MKRLIQQKTMWAICSPLTGTGEFSAAKWNCPIESPNYKTERQKSNESVQALRKA